MKSLLGFVKENLILVIFFIFLTISLFLGDGKQPFVDSYLGLGILLCYFVAYYTKIKIKSPPKPVFILWSLILAYFVSRTVFSDSVGYSISATVRLIEAFLVYILFYSLTNQKTIKYFSHGLEVLAVTATVSSLFLIFFPNFTRFLPSMNLLYSTYGHNHLVDLLLFVVPLSFCSLGKKGFWSKIFVGVVLLGVMISFSRGAWLVILGYAFFYLIKNKYYDQLKAATLVLLVLICGWLVLDKIIFSTKIGSQPIPAAYLWLKRQVVKPSLWDDPRLEYWRQAFTAISERPWFGSGPGTFYLESKRLQTIPVSWSWFAHSFPLQTAAEGGLFGALINFLLFFINGKKLWEIYKEKDSQPEAKQLILSLILILFYSFFEYNLDFLTIWLLMWATMGLVLGLKQQSKTSYRGNKMTRCGLIILTLFYLSGAVSEIYYIRGNYRNTYLLTPFDASRAISYFQHRNKNSRLSPFDLQLVNFFHNRNPEVVYAMAQSDQTEKDYATMKQLYLTVLSMDPLSTEYNDYYLHLIVKHDFKDVVTRDKLLNSLDHLLQRNYYFTPMRLYGYAVIDYDAGLKTLTPKLLSAAIKLDPGFSFWHVELANYYLNNKDVEEAKKTINQCLILQMPPKHCYDFLINNIDQRIIMPVGFLSEVIDNYFLSNK